MPPKRFLAQFSARRLNLLMVLSPPEANLCSPSFSCLKPSSAPSTRGFLEAMSLTSVLVSLLASRTAL
ncbi:MAG: hypothetical protein AB1576_06685 [Bacillota bacterium]